MFTQTCLHLWLKFSPWELPCSPDRNETTHSNIAGKRVAQHSWCAGKSLNKNSSFLCFKRRDFSLVIVRFKNKIFLLLEYSALWGDACRIILLCWIIKTCLWILNVRIHLWLYSCIYRINQIQRRWSPMLEESERTWLPASDKFWIYECIRKCS